MVAALYVPAKRRLAIDDPFFNLGNAEASLCHHAKTEQRLQSSRPPGDPSGGGDLVDKVVANALEAAHIQPAAVVVCHEHPCLGTASFPNAMAFERHYDQMHRNVCSLCYAVLPSSHWLDLHLQESHDAFFDARLARGDALFACFLPTCACVFVSAEERRVHMVEVHGFARSFNWDLVSRGLRVAGISEHDDSESDSESDCGSNWQPSDIKEAEESNASWAAHAGDSSSMDLDQITSDFGRSVRISAPDKISFGYGNDDDY
ncbi:hypothetical protein GGI07_003465 [Coemansia sp. Benny D115]|nr:hypothetical protein GGI07_003465 [Coemansia sp. Benny D115]